MDKKIFEGEETLEVVSGKKIETNDLNEIYPADVKISREYFSIYELKRKFEERKTLILDPEFQREFVWNKTQKSELIESILMGIPLPVMYFAEDKYGKLQVIDGRQRLGAFFEFLNNKFAISSVPILKHLKGKKFKDLSLSEQAKLEDYQIIIYIIKPQNPDRIKFDIFDRVNRGGTQLNKQEMRNALYQGKSTKLLKELSETQEFLNATGKAFVNNKRMKDRYLILRFIGFYLWRKKKISIEYKSDIDDFLGKIMEILNNFQDNQIEELKDIFKFAMTNSFKILGEDGFRLPSKGKKKPINMALFETISYLMTYWEVLIDEEKTKEKVNNLFKDYEFIDSLTQRVDSSRSVEIRFSKVEKILEELK